MAYAKMPENYWCIYILREPDNDDFLDSIRYVGYTGVNPKKRLNGHCTYHDNPTNNYRLNWTNYLYENKIIPIMEIIDEGIASDDEGVWQSRETYWIQYHRELNCRLVNSTNGGDGIHGFAGWTDEERKRRSIAMKGKPKSEETKRKLSESLMGHGHSEETRKKISEAGRGRPQSIETREKRKQTLKNNGYRKPSLTEEQKKKVSDGLKKYFAEQRELQGKTMTKGEENRIRVEKNKETPRKNTPETIEKMKESHRELWRKRKMNLCDSYAIPDRWSG